MCLTGHISNKGLTEYPLALGLDRCHCALSDPLYYGRLVLSSDNLKILAGWIVKVIFCKAILEYQLYLLDPLFLNLSILIVKVFGFH